MNVITTPKPWQSVFRDACFDLGGIDAPGGIDIAICSADAVEPLGIKRLYAQGAASVNVAPYMRRVFAVEPLCGGMVGLGRAVGRVAMCYLEAPGFTSAAVPLTCGTVDAEVNEMLSAAPETVKIRPGERDEVSLVTGTVIVTPFIVFNHEGVDHIDNSFSACSVAGMVTMVVDADEIASRLGSAVGVPASEIGEFTVELRSGTGVAATVLHRRYSIDRTSRGGRRLAWVNSYGAVDYYTFPVVPESRVSGRCTRILTSGGYRTVATAAESTETLMSEPCDEGMAGWLAEIMSSPAVWTIEGERFERVEVAGGEVKCRALQPRTVMVEISPATKTPSRKL